MSANTMEKETNKKENTNLGRDGFSEGDGGRVLLGGLAWS
jgi:hypothetical protein